MSNTRLLLIALAAIVALGAFFRFYNITEIPLGLYPDEAMNGNNALEALAGSDFKVFYPENNGREGLFINIQALSLYLFGNEPWALRVVSALFGTLTILGVYFLTKELLLKSHFNSYRSETSIALLSSFFLATSFWHINFSRIGFRAIMVPFFAAFGTYFLLKGLRRGTTLDMIWAGVFIGLGLQTYIAFRFIPFVLAVPILWYLWQWWKGTETAKGCIPCLVVTAIIAALVVFAPLGIYFLDHPEDFFGRGGQVSVFASESPVFEFLKSNIATVGMFFVSGDCNWRHNYNCRPELYPIVAVFFVVGTIILLYSLISKSETLISKQSQNPKDQNNFRDSRLEIRDLTLLAWLFFLALPATLTREGIPHALRAIGMLPAMMIVAGVGAYHTGSVILSWFEMQKQKWPQHEAQLNRIRREILLLFLLVILLIPVGTFKQYFVRWAHNTNTYYAFSTDILHAGEFVRDLPRGVKKYVVVNFSGTEVRGIPMPAQPVMFVTDTFRVEEQNAKNIHYLLPRDVDSLAIGSGKTVIVVLNGLDRDLISEIRTKFPQLSVEAPSDFVIFKTK